METNTTQTRQEKLAPHHVQARLSRDVHSILRTCLNHFDEEEREYEDKRFNVDAVISGRSVEKKMMHERRNEAPKVRTVRQPEYVQPLTLAARGNFIPSSHFAQLFAI